MKVAIIGGGAAGFFAAIRHKECYPDHSVTIFEKTSKVLGKVKISGGGRCNVTHACFTPKELVQYYPRGGKELLGPFHRFAPADTVAWFENRGVVLKVEEDGRMFPITDDAQTIINCFMHAASQLGIAIEYKFELKEIIFEENGFELGFKDGIRYHTEKLILSSGSNDSVWGMLKTTGHTLVPPVPSLFTFNISDDRLRDFPGISWPGVQIKIDGTKFESHGSLLITHWGLSGPAILKLSSIAAVELNKMNYDFNIRINFMYPNTLEEVHDLLKKLQASNLNKLVMSTPLNGFTSRLWQNWCEGYFNIKSKRWQEVSKKEISAMASLLTQTSFRVQGKSVFKEEFVTAGGVDLRDVDMKTMQSKKIKNLFFAGEILNIDALTGGFNFQAAWTTGWIAGSQ